MKRNTGFKIIFALYLVFFFADVITTLYNGPLIPILELNPLYRLLHSLIPVLILNILTIMLFVWLYYRNKSTPTIRYIVMAAMVLIVLIRILAVYNASQMMPLAYNMTHTYNASQNIQVLAELNQTVTSDVVQKMQILYAGLMYIPLIYTLLVYFFWKVDHKIKKKDDDS